MEVQFPDANARGGFGQPDQAVVDGGMVPLAYKRTGGLVGIANVHAQAETRREEKAFFMAEGDQYRFTIFNAVTVGRRKGIVLACGQDALNLAPLQFAGIVAQHCLGVMISEQDHAVVVDADQGSTFGTLRGVGTVSTDKEFFHDGKASAKLWRERANVIPLLFFCRFCHDSVIILIMVSERTSPAESP